MSDAVGKLDVRWDVGVGVVPDERLRYLEVRECKLDPVGYPLVHRPHHRMTLAQEQASTWPQQALDDPRPAADVGKPTQRADSGENQIELAGGHPLERAVHVRLDEADV